MSSRRISLQLWRWQRLRSAQIALRPRDSIAPCSVPIFPNYSASRRAYSSSRDDDFTVREFVPGPKGKENVEIEPDIEGKIEAELLREEMDELRKEIEVLQDGPFGPNSKFMKALPPHLKEKILKALEEEGDNRPENLELEDITDEDFDRIVEESKGDDFPVDRLDDPIPNVPSVSLELPQKSKAYVAQFNKALGHTMGAAGNQERQLALWKCYLRCRAHVRGFSEMVSDEVWDILWESHREAPQRVHHLLMLAKDVLQSGNPLTPSQWIDYIKCLQESGDAATALARWKEVEDVLGTEEDTKAEFCKLGVRLYAAAGQPAESMRVASSLPGNGAITRDLIPVIAAFAKQNSHRSPEKAWTLYLRLKTALGPDLTMSDFESISTSLLTADKPDLALAVFKDMLLSQQASPTDSLALFKAAHDYIDELQDSKITEDEVNRVSLAALTVLPQSFQNKFFYASWIKKLIGLGEVDAAATVVELMYARGVRPDARHLNGIIGAWMRKNEEPSQKRAEAMAWSMIEKRLQFVEGRQEQDPSKSRRARDIAIRRPVPAATIETFSILLQHYLQAGNMAEADHIMDELSVAELKPDAFVLNQWIFSSLRRGQTATAWTKYQSLRSDGVRPDLETFASLFDCGKVQYDTYRTMDTHRFPRSRELYAEMHRWLSSLTGREAQQVKEQFTRDLYDQIIRCFCLSHDLRGALCAMHGLKRKFAMHPDANTARMIMLAVSSHLGIDDAQSSKGSSRRVARRQRAQNPKTSLAKVSALLNAIADRKAVMVSGEEGANPESLPDERKAEIQLDILSQFIVVVLARNVPAGHHKDQATMIEHIERVATSMGEENVTIAWDEMKNEI